MAEDKIEITFECLNCGGTILSLPDDYTDDSIDIITLAPLHLLGRYFRGAFQTPSNQRRTIASMRACLDRCRIWPLSNRTSSNGSMARNRKCGRRGQFLPMLQN